MAPVLCLRCNRNHHGGCFAHYPHILSLTKNQLGKSFGLIEAGTDKGGFIAALHRYLVYCANVGIYAEWHPIMHRLVSALPAQGFAWLGKFVQQQVNSRMVLQSAKSASDNDNDDFLAQVLKLHASKDDFLMEDVFGVAMINIGAGSDTTSVSLASILYHLMTSPEKLLKASTHLFLLMHVPGQHELTDLHQNSYKPKSAN